MLKLPKLPDRTPVKLTIALNPELHQRLQSYAALYRDTYGTPEPVADLIPYMLDAFLDSDRTYTKVTKVDRGGRNVSAAKNVVWQPLELLNWSLNRSDKPWLPSGYSLPSMMAGGPVLSGP